MTDLYALVLHLLLSIGPFPDSIHPTTFAALAGEGLIELLPAGTWAITAKGTAALGHARQEAHGRVLARIRRQLRRVRCKLPW